MGRWLNRAMWRSIGTRSFVSVVLAGGLVAGCSKSEPPAARPSPTYTLRKLELPDLGHAAPSVRQQLRDGYAQLLKKIDAPSTPSDELGQAYGQFGMLLMAAEYRGEAESAFLNAQTFNPRDP